MAEKISSSGTNTKLLGSAKNRRSSVSSQDVVVENIAEKRYLWTARAFAVITAISICCNIILFLTLSQVVPLYRVEPFLLTFQDKEEQVYNIQPITRSLEDEKAITEVFIRQYILLRSTFITDIAEMEARWGENGAIREMSTPQIYSDFIENTAKRAIEVIRSRGLKRDVKIITINELSRGLWQVEYETQDLYPTSTAPEINYWTASLKITYRHKTVKYKERLNNPVGFTVVTYSLARNQIN